MRRLSKLTQCQGGLGLKILFGFEGLNRRYNYEENSGYPIILDSFILCLTDFNLLNLR